MMTKYYDGFRTHPFDILDAFGFFGSELTSTKNRTDVIDGEGIKIEMPGVSQSDLEVTVDNRVLKISAKSRHGKEFSHTYSLKSGVDEGSIEAHLQDGLLEVKLPKKKEAQARRIPIT